jgi:nucleotide-binding universal stress UspA family protein
MSEQIVVVGVDGSPASYTALRWALRHVGRTGGQVRAIRCLRPVAVPAWEAAVTGEPVPASAEQQVRAERELDQIVAAALVRVRDGAQRVAVRRRVVHGPAGPVLVAEAGGAALLVVGSHGHRRLTELAHRSVSAYCIRHTSCPVVVVPPASEWGASWPRWRPGAGRKRVSSRVKRWPGWGLGTPQVHPVGRRGQRRCATVEEKGRPG